MTGLLLIAFRVVIAIIIAFKLVAVALAGVFVGAVGLCLSQRKRARTQLAANEHQGSIVEARLDPSDAWASSVVQDSSRRPS